MSDNSWYENGELPPVGIDVEYCGDMTGVITKDFKVGDKLKCIAHEYMRVDLMPVFWNYRLLSATTLVSSSYRPIKTERELAIEEMKLIMKDANFCTYGKVAAVLYDAGYRKNES